MIGAILGDYVGSRFERRPQKSVEFELFHKDCRFTDDTIMTLATADALKNSRSYKEAYVEWGRRNPRAGYGQLFLNWLASSNPQPYGSYGNGAAMRVSPIGWAFNSLNRTLEEAKKSAIVSHDHPEGIKGAQAVATSIYLARVGKNKEFIQKTIEDSFGYDLSISLDELRPSYQFNTTCQGSVPQAIRCFLESENWESAVRNAVSLGGDADTMACIAGGIAEAFNYRK